MSAMIFIIMVVLLIVALERSSRRQSLQAPGLHGSENRDDRDWARIKLDLMALDDNRLWATATTMVLARPDPSRIARRQQVCPSKRLLRSGHRRDQQ